MYSKLVSIAIVTCFLCIVTSRKAIMNNFEAIESLNKFKVKTNRFVLAASTAMLLFAACQEKEPKQVAPSVIISENTATVDDVELSYGVSVESNVELTVVSDADWATAKYAEGKLDIKVEENYGAERTANITLNYNESPVSSFKLVQKAGATDEITEVEAFYYGKIDSYGEGTENWTISFYDAPYLDESVSGGYVYTFDIMAPSEFTFVSGAFPTGTYDLISRPEVGAIYDVDSYVMDGETWDRSQFTSATLTIKATDVADEYVLNVKAHAPGNTIKFSFKAVCGGGNGYDLRKYDTRVNSTITQDYEITFSAYEAYVYGNDDQSYDLDSPCQMEHQQWV